MWIGGGGVFQNGGLVLAIASKMPADKKQTMYDLDANHDKLLKASRKTGIEERLQKANKKYFALSPRWAEKDKELTTKFPVVYWLNPFEQHLNNHGWYTVEQLDQWIEGKGPIPKEK
jgi:hypothetical protein